MVPAPTGLCEAPGDEHSAGFTGSSSWTIALSRTAGGWDDAPGDPATDDGADVVASAVEATVPLTGSSDDVDAHPLSARPVRRSAEAQLRTFTMLLATHDGGECPRRTAIYWNGASTFGGGDSRASASAIAGASGRSGTSMAWNAW